MGVMTLSKKLKRSSVGKLRAETIVQPGFMNFQFEINA